MSRRPLHLAGRSISCALLLSCAWRTASADEPPRWTLEQLIREGQRSHGTIEAAEKGLESARQQLQEAQRAWWPNFSVEGLIAPSVDIRCADNLTGHEAGGNCLSANVNNP